MPTFTFTSPEGKTHTIEGPEGATRAQAWEMLQIRERHVNTPAPAAPSQASSGATVDIAKQGGAGLLEGLASLPGAAARMAQSAGEFVQPYIGNPEAEASRQALRAQIDALPGSPAAMEKAVASVLPGAAETGPGQYARTAGRMIPGAVLGMKGSVPGAVATGVGAGVGSEAAGQATEGTGYEGLARLGGGLVGGGITAAAASKLLQDAAKTAVATNTAPQAAAASGNGPLAAALHSPAADTAAGLAGLKGKLGLGVLRKLFPKGAEPEAPVPAPTQPWETPGLPAPGVETGPWGPWNGLKQSPTMPNKPPWQTPTVEDATPTFADLQALARMSNIQPQRALPPPSGGPINMPQGPQPLGLPAPAPGPASPFPGPQPGGPMPMSGRQVPALPPPGGAIPMPAPAPQLALPPPSPVVTAKAISKVNGKVKTTPGDAVPAPNEPPAAPDTMSDAALFKRGAADAQAGHIGNSDSPAYQKGVASVQTATTKTPWSTPTLTNPYLEHTAVEAQLGPAAAAAHVIDNLKARPDYKFTQSPIALQSYLTKVFGQKDAVAKSLAELTGDPEQALRGHVYALKTNKEASAWRSQLSKQYGEKPVEAAFPAANLQKWWRK